MKYGSASKKIIEKILDNDPAFVDKYLKTKVKSCFFFLILFFSILIDIQN